MKFNLVDVRSYEIRFSFKVQQVYLVRAKIADTDGLEFAGGVGVAERAPSFT